MASIFPTSTKLCFFRGDTHKVVLKVKQIVEGVSSVVDISGAVGTLSVKANASDTAYVLQKSGTVIDGTGGKMMFTINPSDTQALTPGTYIYDVQLVLADNSVYTVLKDSFVLKEGITLP